MPALRALVRHYEWVHLGIGILGNLTFLAGSLLFMEKVEPLSLYLFIAGSIGMLIGNVGSAVVRLARSSSPDTSRTHRGRGSSNDVSAAVSTPFHRLDPEAGNRRVN